MVKAWKHFKTVTKHRRLVRKYCFRLGMYWQGITHDLSKYSPAEFLQGCKYYLGYRSPNDAERKATGCSLAWMHHKGRNKHHSEYWTDFPAEPNGEKCLYVPMPAKYLAENICDRIAASQIYHGEEYTDADPYDYLEHSKSMLQINEQTLEQLEKALLVLKEHGEEVLIHYVKENLLGKGENV